MFRVKGFEMLRIKEAREARGWTQEQLAAAMNTTQQESDEVRLLSADEHELIDCYRSLSTKTQRALLAGLREYLQ